MFHVPYIFIRRHRFKPPNDFAQGRPNVAAPGNEFDDFGGGGRGAATRGCPWGWGWGTDLDDGVEMVWHYDLFVELYGYEFAWYTVPPFLNHEPRFVVMHFAIFYFPEQGFSILGANGDEVRC